MKERGRFVKDKRSPPEISMKEQAGQVPIFSILDSNTTKNRVRRTDLEPCIFFQFSGNSEKNPKLLCWTEKWSFWLTAKFKSISFQVEQNLSFDPKLNVLVQFWAFNNFDCFFLNEVKKIETKKVISNWKTETFQFQNFLGPPPAKTIQWRQHNICEMFWCQIWVYTGNKFHLKNFF